MSTRVVRRFGPVRPAPSRVHDDEWMSRTLRIIVLLIAVLGLVAAPAPTHAAAAAAVARWSWPVAAPHPVVRPFIAPATAYSAGHRGVDIAANGDVLAPADGIVHFVGFVVDRPVLSLEHPGAVLSSYEPVVSSLHVGDKVTRGEVIGQVVAGHCAQLCLHFGVRVRGEYVSPMLFLGGIPYSVLLPTRRLVVAGTEKRKTALICSCELPREEIWSFSR
jgi:murein DD-endopeptidase MepM/ murein hydrolase activator NlpD